MGWGGGPVAAADNWSGKELGRRRHGSTQDVWRRREQGPKGAWGCSPSVGNTTGIHHPSALAATYQIAVYLAAIVAQPHAHPCLQVAPLALFWWLYVVSGVTALRYLNVPMYRCAEQCKGGGSRGMRGAPRAS